MIETQAGLLASSDRWLAAVTWARRQFPENAHTADNARIDEAMRDALAEDTERKPEHAHLLVRATEAVMRLTPDETFAVPDAPNADGPAPTGPDPATDAAVRAAAPTTAACDYCAAGSVPVAALLPVAASPQIVVLCLCGRCTGLLDAKYPSTRLVFPTATPDSPERIEA